MVDKVSETSIPPQPDRARGGGRSFWGVPASVEPRAGLWAGLWAGWSAAAQPASQQVKERAGVSRQTQTQAGRQTGHRMQVGDGSGEAGSWLAYQAACPSLPAMAMRRERPRARPWGRRPAHAAADHPASAAAAAAARQTGHAPDQQAGRSAEGTLSARPSSGSSGVVAVPLRRLLTHSPPQQQELSRGSRP